MSEFNRQKCHFCRNNIASVDYKRTDVLKKYLTSWSKIKPAGTTGVCSRHQRQLTTAIKRARFLALVPYVTR